MSSFVVGAQMDIPVVIQQVSYEILRMKAFSWWNLSLITEQAGMVIDQHGLIAGIITEFNLSLLLQQLWEAKKKFASSTLTILSSSKYDFHS